MDSLMGKGRKPRFELYLKIHDLNNIPLVSGTSYIKWHLAHSMHAEHRGRTTKSAIVNHRVDFNFSKHIQHIRISVDKNNNLVECPLEFEVVQEFAVTEKITLGVVRLNLSEYVDESENLAKDLAGPARRRTNSLSVSPTSVPPAAADSADGTEGVVRRYLMQESKINSTLKISILIVQTDGDRNFIAPPLRLAPTFGGIAGIVRHDQATEEDTGPTPNVAKPRDGAEIQDLYRRTLSASWCRLPSELPADECIEDIFCGGNGWRTQNEGNSTDTEEDDDGLGHGTLRPGDLRRFTASSQHHSTRTHHGHSYHVHNPFHHRDRDRDRDRDQNQEGASHTHRRTGSAASERSTATLRARGRGAGSGSKDARDASDTSLSRSGSLTTMSSGRSGGEASLTRERVREVDEAEVRDDLVAWRLPSTQRVAA